MAEKIERLFRETKDKERSDIELEKDIERLFRERETKDNKREAKRKMNVEKLNEKCL